MQTPNPMEVEKKSGVILQDVRKAKAPNSIKGNKKIVIRVTSSDFQLGGEESKYQMIQKSLLFH